MISGPMFVAWLSTALSFGAPALAATDSDLRPIADLRYGFGRWVVTPLVDGASVEGFVFATDERHLLPDNMKVVLVHGRDSAGHWLAQAWTCDPTEAIARIRDDLGVRVEHDGNWPAHPHEEIVGPAGTPFGLAAGVTDTHDCHDVLESMTPEPRTALVRTLVASGDAAAEVPTTTFDGPPGVLLDALADATLGFLAGETETPLDDAIEAAGGGSVFAADECTRFVDVFHSIEIVGCVGPTWSIDSQVWDSSGCWWRCNYVGDEVCLLKRWYVRDFEFTESCPDCWVFDPGQLIRRLSDTEFILVGGDPPCAEPQPRPQCQPTPTFPHVMVSESYKWAARSGCVPAPQ